jgi:hypothetical protein
MAETINGHELVAQLALDLENKGIPMDQIADWFLVTALGILDQAHGREHTAARLELAVKQLRSAKPTGETRQH